MLNLITNQKKIQLTLIITHQIGKVFKFDTVCWECELMPCWREGVDGTILEGSLPRSVKM